MKPRRLKPRPSRFQRFVKLWRAFFASLFDPNYGLPKTEKKVHGLYDDVGRTSSTHMADSDVPMAGGGG